MIGLCDGIGACAPVVSERGAVDRRVGVAGEHDQAQVRVVASKPRQHADTVEQRHVQVDDDRVRVEGVRELERPQAVLRLRDHLQLRLLVDQGLQGLEECRVVVGEKDPDRTGSHRNLAYGSPP